MKLFYPNLKQKYTTYFILKYFNVRYNIDIKTELNNALKLNELK